MGPEFRSCLLGVAYYHAAPVRQTRIIARIRSPLNVVRGNVCVDRTRLDCLVTPIKGSWCPTYKPFQTSCRTRKLSKIWFLKMYRKSMFFKPEVKHFPRKLVWTDIVVLCPGCYDDVRVAWVPVVFWFQPHNLRNIWYQTLFTGGRIPTVSLVRCHLPVAACDS